MKSNGIEYSEDALLSLQTTGRRPLVISVFVFLYISLFISDKAYVWHSVQLKRDQKHLLLQSKCLWAPGVILPLTQSGVA